MARSFNGTTQYLEKATPVLTAAPITLACWAQATSASATTGYSLISISDIAAANNYFRLALSEVTAGAVDAEARSSTTIRQSTVTIPSFAANTWYHCCAVFASATSRTAYGNGVAGTADTNSATPTGLDVTTIGLIHRNTNVEFHSGLIAECGIWSAALDQQEITALAAGVSPLLIRPTSLVSYAPLIGQYSPEIDLFSPTGYTLNAAPTAAAHCRIFK